jgi:uncharacterized protein YndB with AHSA1/START domain
MKPLLFDFIVNKDNNTITVRREFAAVRTLVWDAFAKSEILDLWWAPQPWRSTTKSMDFTVGGRRLYAMVSPEGEEHWSWADFTDIQPKNRIGFLDAFCDSEGNINTTLPRSEWCIDFEEMEAGHTLVNILISHDSLAAMEENIAMGFKEGFTMTLDYLANTIFGKPNGLVQITIATTVNAPVAKVWDCWTSPEHIKKWNHANDDWHTTKAENDLRVGGSFTSRMEAKDGSFGFDFGGTYDVVDVHQRIAYTLEDDRKVNITFTAQGTQTIVVETFEAESQNFVELQQQGWQMILDNFRRYCEGIS